MMPAMNIRKRFRPRSPRYYAWKAKRLVLGKAVDEGPLYKLFLYFLFMSTTYIYLHPLLKMMVKMVMDAGDLMDPTVTWIPTGLYWGNLQTAWEALRYMESAMISLSVALLVAGLHVVSCGIAGYALARLDFPFKKTIFVLLLVSFIIPPQVIVLPTIIAYNAIGLNSSLVSLVIPAAFGFGTKGSLFIIIYRQFFSTQPRELEEAAKIDGASAFRFYVKVMFPLAKPAMIVVFLFSFVWTWNDTYLPRMFLGAAEHVPLAVKLSRMDAELDFFVKSAQLPVYLMESIKMAAGFLAILPPLVIYFFTQRYFVESVERTGLVE